LSSAKKTIDSDLAAAIKKRDGLKVGSKAYINAASAVTDLRGKLSANVAATNAAAARLSGFAAADKADEEAEKENDRLIEEEFLMGVWEEIQELPAKEQEWKEARADAKAAKALYDRYKNASEKVKATEDFQEEFDGEWSQGKEAELK
jgi:hypothetical protein